MGAFRIRTVENRPPHDDLLERVAAQKPDVLMVTPETLDLILGQAADSPRLSLAHIFTGANQLPRSVRQRAIETFDAALTDFYGTSECSLVAWECRRCGLYHTSDDSVIVEVVGDEGDRTLPGEEGELVLTVLHSRAMPFLRLRLGDRVRRPREPRPCAVRFGALESIEGRMVDYLRLPNGQRLAPLRVLLVIDQIAGVGRWEISQESETRFTLRFEPLPDADRESVASGIRAGCASLFPSGVEVDVQAVRFDAAGTGVEKLRFVRGMRAGG
jgi:phenylacetate-CoA ligase